MVLKCHIKQISHSSLILIQQQFFLEIQNMKQNFNFCYQDTKWQTITIKKHLGASSVLLPRNHFLTLSCVSIAFPFCRIFQDFIICLTEDLMSICCQYMAKRSISFQCAYAYVHIHTVNLENDLWLTYMELVSLCGQLKCSKKPKINLCISYLN